MADEVFCISRTSRIFADVEGIYLLTSGVPDQPAEICNSYLEEASVGRDVKLHVILFSIDEMEAMAITSHGGSATSHGGALTNHDGVGDEFAILPCRYASTSQTAHVLRDMAHSTVGGRFHWVTNTGE